MAEGMIHIADLTDVEARVVVGEVLTQARNKYHLRELCRVIKVPDLIGDVPMATKLACVKHVPALEEANLVKEAYDYVHFDLAAYGKNVVHIAISYEAQHTKSIVGDIYKQNIADAAKALAEAENEDIAGIMHGSFTEQTGSDWGGDNDPSDDVLAGVAALLNLDLGYDPGYLVLNPLGWADLVSNDYVRKQMERSMMVKGEVPTYCGLKVFVDVDVTPNTSAYIIDKEAPAIALGDGPSMTEEYKGNARFFTGYAIAKFAEPKVIRSNAAIELTGIHA